jgi:hypothetical protein
MFKTLFRGKKVRMLWSTTSFRSGTVVLCGLWVAMVWYRNVVLTFLVYRRLRSEKVESLFPPMPNDKNAWRRFVRYKLTN